MKTFENFQLSQHASLPVRTWVSVIREEDGQTTITFNSTKEEAMQKIDTDSGNEFVYEDTSMKVTMVGDEFVLSGGGFYDGGWDIGA